MRNATSNRHRFQVAITIVAVLALQGLWVGAGATTPVAPIAAPDLRSDLGNELRTIESYHDELVAYNGLAAQLGKRASIRQADIDPLQRKSADLQQRLSGVQNAIRQVIQKLKAAGQWDNLDAALLAGATDPKLRTLIQGGSFKQELEQAAANLSSQANEISIPLENLRRRLKAQTFSSDRSAAVVRVAHSSATPMAFGPGLACRVGVVRIKLIKRLGGNPNNQTLDTVSCTCNPGNSTGVGTGKPCTEVLGGPVTS